MKTLFTILSLLLCNHVFANPIDNRKAEQIAMSFVAGKTNSNKSIATQQTRLTQILEPKSKQSGKGLLHVFNRNDNNGYIIVAADDKVSPIIAYSDAESLDLDDMPDNLRSWLEYMCEQMTDIIDNNALPLNIPAHAIQQEITPMIKTQWGQGSPYNSLCPTNGNGNKCLTGCVATAMGQIMNYHKYPEKGFGSNTYTCNIDDVPTTLSANFGSTTYQWSDMETSYDDNSSINACNAVGTLMLHCGIATDMAYGTSSSSTTIKKVKTSLVQYFGYSPKATYTNYGLQPKFENIYYDVLNSLSEGCPVLYGGQNKEMTSGHAFVCDGFKEGLFHMNWGADGKGDGYFALSLLNPFNRDYTYNPSLLLYIKPSQYIDDNMFQYDFKDGAATIVGNSSVNETVTIPASINYNGISYPIVRIYKDALYYNKNIKKIIIDDSEQPLIVDKNALPNDITSLYIGRNIEDTDIFSNNPYLKELTFGPNFTTVNSRMFYNCTAIECISTQNVQTIGDKAFANCHQLNNITFGDKVSSLGSSALQNTSIEYIDAKNLVLIGDSAFKDCTSLKQVNLGNKVRRIGNYAFSHNGNLKEMSLPNSLEKLGCNCFEECVNLEKIVFGSGLKAIKDRTFSHCALLSNIVLPATLNDLGENTFEYCCNIESITLPDGIAEIGEECFLECTGLKEINLPGNLTEVKRRAFFNCSSLQRITLPNTLTNIGYGCFRNCKSIMEIDFSDNLINIDTKAFAGCESIEKISLPSSIESMKEAIFKYCTGLKEINIPEKIDYIPYETFSGCKSLQHVITKENQLNSIGGMAFYNCSSLKIIPDINNLSIIEIQAFYGCESLKEINLSKTIKRLEANTFTNCKGIESVDIPDNVMSIEEACFQGCESLRKVHLPKSVRALTWQVFGGCTSLEEINFHDGITEIYDEAFCPNTNTDSNDGIAITELKLPESLEVLGTDAFRDCHRLKTLDLPLSFIRNDRFIYESAFASCENIRTIFVHWDKSNKEKFDKSRLYIDFDDDVFMKATLFVPVGSLEMYQQHDYWKRFKNIMEYDVANISHDPVREVDLRLSGDYLLVNTNTKNVKVYVYDSSGNKVGESNGCNDSIKLKLNNVYIIKYNGKSFKVRL